ncbi:hypothetical protein H920_15594 [Fukomys damarensis]|uniref:Uncharacterized protein n=1 Tax=Fukomys damarensis TaxID=885580 RepID=A0A091DJP5_FUKDA|nr:hypothetical protein H920_15594 [Fukomys damarensis]
MLLFKLSLFLRSPFWQGSIPGSRGTDRQINLILEEANSPEEKSMYGDGLGSGWYKFCVEICLDDGDDDDSEDGEKDDHETEGEDVVGVRKMAAVSVVAVLTLQMVLMVASMLENYLSGFISQTTEFVTTVIYDEEHKKVLHLLPNIDKTVPSLLDTVDAYQYEISTR